MSVYIHWQSDKASIFERDKFLILKHEEHFLAVERECSNCLIFDKQNKKCTHPKMGCSASEDRVKPWTKWIKCPIKLSKYGQQAQKS